MIYAHLRSVLSIFIKSVGRMGSVSALAIARVYESREEIILLVFLAVIVWLGLILYSLDAHGQDKWIVTPSRGGAEGAKGMAMIHTLLEENRQRKNETSDLDGRLGTAEDDISTLQAEMADIEPHAKAALSACSSSGRVLHWDGGAWVCADEVDPTVGQHALITKTPPFCHEVNAKLIWSADDGGSWKCAIDQMGDTSPYITAETDPTIQSVAAGRLCYGTGAKIACDSAAPSLSGGTLGVSSLNASGDITGTAAHFTGAVSGALPTATNHLATKAYVDSAVVAAGGGSGNLAALAQCHVTGNSYLGTEIGGLAGADQKCAAEFGSGFRYASYNQRASSFAFRHYSRDGQSTGWCSYVPTADCAQGSATGYSGQINVSGTSMTIGNGYSYPCGSKSLPLICCNF